MSLITNFQKYGNDLTPLEIDCFNQLIAFQKLEPSLTISSLAETLNVSTTTIFRMVKKLNYDSFMDFRYDLLYHRQERFEHSKTHDDVIGALEKEMHDTMEMLRQFDIKEIVEKIVNAKSVLICSSGMNKYVAKILAIKLSLYGIRTIDPDDPWFLYLEANHLCKDDFVIVLSKNGSTETLNDVMKNAKVSGSKILLITEARSSPMTKIADYVMNISVSADEGYDIDSRLHIHIAIEYLLRELTNQYLSNRKYL